MEEALEKESINQRIIHNKARRSMWHMFLIMVACIGLGQLFLKEVTGYFYLGALLFYSLFLYQTYMSRKTNQELWKIWEDRWRDHRVLFNVQSSFIESINVIIPAILSADFSWVISGIFTALALFTGFRNGQNKWKAKEYYYKEYIELTG
ncbi:hypothetical protein [Halobacillus litoralis]|uniref:hypothetical protein n=1 Tax=Halobacillus litoralis TaxID=45668 RepID=UPI001CFD08AD|nr:hypothetical protein [Halobacillus litoralis]